jgi:hypothetical protein
MHCRHVNSRSMTEQALSLQQQRKIKKKLETHYDSKHIL